MTAALIRILSFSLLASTTALAGAAPAVSPHGSASKARPAHTSSIHRDVLPVLLRARLASINARIDMLRSRGALGSEEALELRQQIRRLQSQTYGLSNRHADDVEFGINRLENRVGFVMDDARWGGHAFNRDFGGLHEDRGRDEPNRYEADRHGDYEHFDRYTGSSVDRWHDPFDRGN